jgi:hypothetical protein
MVTKEEFIKHACEQVLRFTRAGNWGDFSEEVKVQIGFNVGAMALGLDLSKEDGFLALASVREGSISMEEFREHIRSIVKSYNIEIDEAMVDRPF